MLKKVLNKAMVIAAICSATFAYSQQEPVFTNYLAAPNVYNPAFAGSQDALNVTFLSRAQWVGIEGAPRSYFVSAHSPIEDKNIGVGLSFVGDQIGFEKYNNLFVDFSYVLPVNATSVIRFGLKAGGSFYSVNFADAQLNNGSDYEFNNGIDNQFLPNAGFGVYWQSDKYFAGASIPRLLQSEIEGVSDTSGTASRISTNDRHIMLMGGASFEVSPDITLKPSLMVRMVGGSPLSADVNVNAVFYDRLWFGVMYRLEEAVGASIGFQLNEQFRVGYSYDAPMFNMNYTTHSGSHEVMLTYDFVFTKGKVTSPRYF